MTHREPSEEVEWTFRVRAPESVAITDLRDAVAAYGDVQSVKFTLRGSESAAVALSRRGDVTEAEYVDWLI